MNPFTIALFTGGSMLANYFGQQSKLKEAKAQAEATAQKYDKMNQAYLRSMLGLGEINTRTDRIGDTYDTAGASAINNTGIASRNLLNPATLTAMTLSRIAGQKAMAMNTEQSRLEDINRELQLKADEAGANAAEVRGQGKALNFDISSLFGSALGGAQAGLSFSNAMQTSDINSAILDKIKETPVKTDVPTLSITPYEDWLKVAKKKNPLDTYSNPLDIYSFFSHT